MANRRLRHFEIVLEVPLPVSEAWERLLDLRAHNRFIPFTRITQGLATADELHPGHIFTACTMIGRMGFNDVMTVESISPPAGAAPGRARIVKSGPLVLGAVDLTVSAHDGGSTVRWSQDFGVGRFAPTASWVAGTMAPLLYRPLLKRLLRHSS
jgi:hypothetical protein